MDGKAHSIREIIQAIVPFLIMEFFNNMQRTSSHASALSLISEIQKGLGGASDQLRASTDSCGTDFSSEIYEANICKSNERCKVRCGAENAASLESVISSRC